MKLFFLTLYCCDFMHLSKFYFGLKIFILILHFMISYIFCKCSVLICFYCNCIKLILHFDSINFSCSVLICFYCNSIWFYILICFYLKIILMLHFMIQYIFRKRSFFIYFKCIIFFRLHFMIPYIFCVLFWFVFILTFLILRFMI